VRLDDLSRQERQRRMNGEQPVERRIEGQLADLLRLLDVADIEHDELRPKRQVGRVADDDGGTVEPVAVRIRGVLRVRILQLQLRQTPSRYFNRVCRIRNIDDHVDLPEVASDGGGGVDVPSAEVPVAMRSESTGLPLTETHRVNRIL